MSDWQGWEQVVESFAGASSQQDTAIWDAWQAKEGAGGAYNPLNTTTPVNTPYGAGVRDPGSWNSAGVLDYPNPQAGSWATWQAVQQNAPGFAQGLKVENPLDAYSDAQLEAGFNWLGGGAGTAENQAYAAAVVESARQSTGSTGGGGGPGPSPAPGTGQTCVPNAWVQTGPGTCKANWGSPADGTLKWIDGTISADGKQCCIDTSAVPPGPRAGSGQGGGGSGLIDCITNASGSSVLGIGVPGSQQLSQLGCFFSLNGLMVIGGAMIMIVGVSKLSGVHVPFVPGAA